MLPCLKLFYSKQVAAAHGGAPAALRGRGAAALRGAAAPHCHAPRWRLGDAMWVINVSSMWVLFCYVNHMLVSQCYDFARHSGLSLD